MEAKPEIDQDESARVIAILATQAEAGGLGGRLMEITAVHVVSEEDDEPLTSFNKKVVEVLFMTRHQTDPWLKVVDHSVAHTYLVAGRNIVDHKLIENTKDDLALAHD